MASTIDPSIKFKVSSQMAQFICDVVKKHPDPLPDSFLKEEVTFLSLNDVKWLKTFMKNTDQVPYSF